MASKIVRRDLLRGSVAAAAGTMTGLLSRGVSAQRMGGGGMGGGGGTTLIDPPVGLPLREIPDAANLTPHSGLVTVEIEARSAVLPVQGTLARLSTYNGMFPGPTIRARRGETLVVKFRNSLPQSGTNILGHDRALTNLHTHGLHVTPKDPGDNVMLSLPPGAYHEYQYDLSLQTPGTLNFYHPHRHGSVAEQYWAGMIGALVIEDESDLFAPFETHLLVLKDMSLSGSAPSPHSTMMDFMHGKEGGIVMVNGQVNPSLVLHPGQVQRWRLVNASNARFYRLSLQNHTMHVVGTDGGLLDKPYEVSEVLLSPGERVDVLVYGSQSKGTFKFLSLPYSRMGMSGSQQVTLMTVSYDRPRYYDRIPAVVDTSAQYLTATTSATRQMALSMGQGRGYINGISFSETQAFEIHSMLGRYELWELRNDSGMDHPFHQHVNACQVLSIQGADPAYAALVTGTPAWKDVVINPKWGSATLLVPVFDWDGMTMFHCHIIEHEDIGMMGHWHIMGMM